MLLFGTLLVFLVIGVPIAAAMGLSSLAYIVTAGMNPIVLVQRMFSGIDSAALLAIPFFVLAGELMNHGGIAKRIVYLVNKLVGNVTGGMAIVAIISTMVFGAISGSAIAAAAAIGGVMYSGLLRSGYSKEFSGALIAASAPLDNIIPPSIGFVIYGVLARVSIADMYKVGFPAGAIMALSLIIPAVIIIKKRNYMEKAEKIESGEIVLEDVPEMDDYSHESPTKAIINTLLAFGTPFIIIGGVFAGIFTPTESAVIACVYSLLIGIFVYKEMTVKDIPRMLLTAANSTATLMIIMACATTFSYLMVYEGIPQAILAKMQAFQGSDIVLLILINIVILIAGMFMEAGAIQYITVPILLPIVMDMGMDPIHFGIIICTNLSIGMVTPPFGITLFTAVRTFNASLQGISREAIPFILCMIVGLYLITFFPQLTMFVL